MSKNPYQIIASKMVYQNPWIRVREDSIKQPTGQEGTYAVLESKDSVMVAVLNDTDQLYLIHVFSYPSASWNWELPGGGSDGEKAIQASKRELREETGITAQKWTLLGKTRVCNGLMTERMSTYLAQYLQIDLTNKKDEAIIDDGRFFERTEVRQMIRDGRINDGQSIAGIALLELWLTS